jgi:Viral BACON domain/Putative binding domain, N-terminal
MQVSANPDASARQGDIVVNGERAPIRQDAARQDAAPCRFEVFSGEQTIPASGGSGGIGVIAASGCAWSARADAAWVVLTSGTTGTGTGTVNFTIASNPGTTTRTTSIVVANQTVRITQQANMPPTLPGCSVAVTPKDVSSPVSGTNNGSISVSATSSCNWSASSNASWISLTGATSGAGNGTVRFSVAANSGTARTGSLKIGDQTVVVSQAGMACTYTISPTSQTFEKSGGAGGPVSVMTQPGCAWTAVSNASWITVTSGSSGTGNGTVTYTVGANTTGSDRTGTLTIARQTFTVTEKK